MEGLVNFDNFGIFILLISIARAVKQLRTTGSSNTSFDVGFTEELVIAARGFGTAFIITLSV